MRTFEILLIVAAALCIVLGAGTGDYYVEAGGIYSEIEDPWATELGLYGFGIVCIIVAVGCHGILRLYEDRKERRFKAMFERGKRIERERKGK